MNNQISLTGENCLFIADGVSPHADLARALFEIGEIDNATRVIQDAYDQKLIVEVLPATGTPKTTDNIGRIATAR